MSASRDILARRLDILASQEVRRRTMTFRYFAYGSNMWTPRMQARCPSARVVKTAVLGGWRAVYDKPSVDGSAKLNIRPDPIGAVSGVVYEVDPLERDLLDRAEPRKRAITNSVALS